MRTLYKNNIVIFSMLFYFCVCPHILPAAGIADSKKEAEIVQITALQEAYDGMTAITPALCMFKTTGTSAVPESLLAEADMLLYRKMVAAGSFKPVTMEKWLVTNFSRTKAKSIVALVGALSDERYTVPLAGICKPYIFRSDSRYVLILSIYSFNAKGYPITTLRMFRNQAELEQVISISLAELQKKYEDPFALAGKQKIAITPFELDCRKCVALKTGEFEYIPASFIEQENVIIKTTDDFYSRTFSYVLSTTGMATVIPLSELDTYADASLSANTDVAYIVQGKIQLTDEINIYHIDVLDAKTKKIKKQVKYFSSDFTLAGVWDAYRAVIVMLADTLFGAGTYGIVPEISTPGQGLFIDDSFIGWDRLTNQVLSKGKHQILAGSYVDRNAKMTAKDIKDVKYKALDADGNLIRAYYAFLDEKNWLFKDVDGEYVWNLLEK